MYLSAMLTWNHPISTIIAQHMINQYTNTQGVSRGLKISIKFCRHVKSGYSRIWKSFHKGCGGFVFQTISWLGKCLPFFPKHDSVIKVIILKNGFTKPQLMLLNGQKVRELRIVCPGFFSFFFLSRNSILDSK